MNPESARIRRPAAAVRRAFVEVGPAGERSPLQGLLSGPAGAGGGAGGRLRIALLLSILWVSASEPFTTRRVASWWARLLELDDPEESGARAIRDTLHELARRGFVRIVRESDGANEVTLLREDGSGAKYAFPDPAEGELYDRIPRTLWDDGWIAKMSGRALAVYLVVASNSGWRDDREFWISSPLFHERYGLGETTRKKGFKELVELGVLDVVARSTTRIDGTRRFRRNIYTLRDDLRTAPAIVPRGQTGTTEL